ncbi:MAG: hypothetical protein RIB97_08170 [Nitratireductor sp.]
MRLVAVWILALMFAVATVPPHGAVSAAGDASVPLAAQAAELDCCDAANGGTIDAAGHCALDCKGLFEPTRAVAPVRAGGLLPADAADTPRELARRRDRPPI